MTEKVKRKKKKGEMDSLRERESHGVWLWGCERRKPTQGREKTGSSEMEENSPAFNSFMENRVMLGC